MANSNGLITAPVSISDVQSALGGVQISSLESLCKFSGINVMAKYKPVPYTADTMSQWDSTNKAWKTTATWFKGTNDNYGINLQGSTSFTSSIISRTVGNKNGWGLETPNPYRLHDFAGYDHKAGRVTFSFPTTATTSTTITGSISQSTGSSGNYVSFSNRLGSSWYFGVAIVNSSNDTVRFYATSNTPTQPAVSFKATGLVYSTYRIFPFFSSKAITAGSLPPSGTIFYPVPYVGPLSCTFTGSTPTTYTYYIKIKNSSSYKTRFDQVYASGPNTVYIGDIGEVAAGATSNAFQLTAPFTLSQVIGSAIVYNTQYPGGEIQDLSCATGACNPLPGGTFILEYTG